MTQEYKLYKYRWVILAVFMFLNLTMQMLWIAYSPIMGPAAEYYGVTDGKIGLLSMVFMIAFIPLSIPVSWIIDKYGYKIAVSIGAILMGIFGLLRGFAGQDYTLVLLCSIGIAIAQPFLLNAWTTIPAKWFPKDERATIVGLITLANLVGTGAGMVITPILYEGGMDIAFTQIIFGAIAVVSSVLFIIFARENPPSPPSREEQEVRALMLDGLKHALTVKPFLMYLAISFVGLGLFNGITTWVEGIIRPRGFTPTDAGTLGALMLVGGLLGAVVLPALSDKEQKRQKYLYIGIALAIPGLIGVTYATNIWVLFISAFVMGFFLVSANPIGMQYATEVTYPTPEGTSNGLIQLCGQAAVVFVYIMEAMRGEDGSFTSSLLLAVGLLAICLILVSQMKDVKTQE